MGGSDIVSHTETNPGYVTSNEESLLKEDLSGGLIYRPIVGAVGVDSVGHGRTSSRGVKGQRAAAIEKQQVVSGGERLISTGCEWNAGPGFIPRKALGRGTTFTSEISNGDEKITQWTS